MDIGAAIRAKRKEKGLTQIEVAQAANISVNSLRLYESGKRELKQSVFISIAHALETSVFDLMGYSTGKVCVPEKDFLDACTDMKNDKIENELDLGLRAITLAKDYNISKEDALRIVEEMMTFYNPLFKTDTEHAMHSSLEELNDLGKKVAIERIRELSEIPQYQKNTLPDK